MKLLDRAFTVEFLWTRVKISIKMENILSNPGLIHIRIQIFSCFDFKTLEICREVFTKRFGEDWDSWLERLSLVKYMLEFGDKVFGKGEEETIKNIIPGWCNAVKKFGKMASLKDLNEVKESINEELSLRKRKCKNGCENCEPTALVHLTAQYNHVKLLELLSHTDVDFNQSYDGETPFTLSCNWGHIAIANLLIDLSKDVASIHLNARNEKGYTGFMRACNGGHTELVNLMIISSKEFGIDLNARLPPTRPEVSAFMMACMNGHTETVNLMINSSKEFGIYLNAKDDEGKTGFMWACRFAQTEVVNLMMQLSKEFDLDLNARNHERETGFMMACYQPLAEVVNLMITSSKKFGIDLNAIDVYGSTAFMGACLEGHREIVDSMITSSKEFGIDLNTKNEDGDTGLVFACDMDHIEVVSLIVENRKKYGINIQQKSNSGLTALDLVNNRIRSMVNGLITFKPSLQKLRDILEEAFAADNEPQPSSKRLRFQELDE